MSNPNTIHGRYTRALLADVSALFAPPQEDAWGYVRPAYSPQLMRLCAELSATTYDFDFSRFFEAGWLDATLQVENRLFEQVDSFYMAKTPREFIRSGLKLRRAKSMLAPALTDVLRAMRQLVATDTGKAVVMALPAGEDRYVVAVSFMGTGKKFYDWFTNFKMSCRGGMHEGFLNTARLFDRNAERIAFPRIAKALGRNALTLADILTECTQKDSRFRLLLCGHSQGGAVAQAYAYLLRTEHALDMDNIVGYTLGAPTVASTAFTDNPAVYPLYHLINADDFVPRMGACMRLGVDKVFVPDPAFRLATYGYAPCDQAHADARERLRHFMRPMRDMPSVIEMFVSLLRALSVLPDPAAAREILTSLNAQLKYLTPAMQSLGLRSEDLLRLLEGQLLTAYRDLTDKSVDETRIAALTAQIITLIQGTDHFAQCLLEVAFAPHGLTGDDPNAQTPYLYIVSRCQSALRDFIFVRNESAVQMLPPADAWYDAPDQADARLPGAQAETLGLAHGTQQPTGEEELPTVPATRNPEQSGNK